MILFNSYSLIIVELLYSLKCVYKFYIIWCWLFKMLLTLGPLVADSVWIPPVCSLPIFYYSPCIVTV